MLSPLVKTSTVVQLARPLTMLEPLIREDIKAGEDAGIAFFVEAGEKLREARAHFKSTSAFYEWAKKKLHRSQTTIYDWMRSAANKHDVEYETETAGNSQPARSKTLSETVYPKRKKDHSAAWVRQPWVREIREVADDLNVRRLAEERQNRVTEKELRHDLGQRLIDIGYKVLAAKLHPDKPGGSEEAMQRLNAVRDILKGAIR